MFLPCWPTFHIFTSFGLYWPTFLLCQPISLIGLPCPIYFFCTTFTPMSLLLNPLGFLGPITTSLSLIIFSGLLAFKPTQLIYQFIFWASPAHLLPLYLLLFSLAYYFIPWVSSAHLLLFYLLISLWTY